MTPSTTTAKPLDERFADQRAANVATYAEWTEAMSGGLLTVRTTNLRNDDLSIVRTDGQPLPPTELEAERELVTYGVLTSRIFVPSVSAVTRRNRTDLRALRDVVRSVLVERFSDDAFAARWVFNLAGFEKRNRIDGGR